MACPGFLTVADIKGDVGATRELSLVIARQLVLVVNVRYTVGVKFKLVSSTVGAMNGAGVLPRMYYYEVVQYLPLLEQ